MTPYSLEAKSAMRRTILASALFVRVSVLLSSGISSAPRQPSAQGVAPVPSGATAAWTLKMKGDIRWQQVMPRISMGHCNPLRTKLPSWKTLRSRCIPFNDREALPI